MNIVYVNLEFCKIKNLDKLYQNLVKAKYALLFSIWVFEKRFFQYKIASFGDAILAM